MITFFRSSLAGFTISQPPKPAEPLRVPTTVGYWARIYESADGLVLIYLRPLRPSMRSGHLDDFEIYRGLGDTRF